MGYKKQLLFFSILILSCFIVDAQELTNDIRKDTVSFSEENTQKVLEFGEFIAATVHNNDSEAFISKLNDKVFFERILSVNPSIDTEDSYIKGFLIGMKRALNSFPNEIIMEVENGAYYDFISYRYDQEAQTYYALFRMYSSESGMNYHDFRIHKENDEILFSDMYVYLSGEHFTETLGRLMTYTLPEKKLFGLLESSPNEESKDLFKAIMHNKNGDFLKAFEIMDGLKSELAKEKFLLIFKSLIASQIDDEKYLKSLEDLINTFPDDPTILLNKIDYHIYKSEYFEAIQVINQLQNATEDDFLNYIKASVAFEDQNYDLALNYFKYTAENYPDFFEGQAGYLNTLIMMNDYPEAVNYLDELIADGYDKPAIIEYIEEDDEYGENILETFSKSKDFKAWKKKKEKN
ncbi:hypothetical protein [uncultured Psychroserpens sp.]|uniref:tetratricopeptide repeat protein n=1 Tax=uncultured Psychroserpens sp. TaxID=255436 RepID=UPI00262F9CE8|nr:hypothetical protein [uncultured Psychroserpens sp.]